MRISPLGMSGADVDVPPDSLSEKTTARVARRGQLSPIVYGGELKEVARLFFANLALSLLTLGIYRFWGKTNMRRYLWSQISFQGEPFEYIGTGRELFLGFLKTAVFVAILVAFSHFVPELASPSSSLGTTLSLISAAAFGFLYLAAQFAAQRYRLSRTQWCGIRGGMESSAWVFAFRSGCLFIISALLIGLLIPWWRMRSMDWRIGAGRIGNLKLWLDPARSICFWSFMLGAVLIGTMDRMTEPLYELLLRLPVGPGMLESLSVGLYIVILLIVAPLVFAPYFANMQQQILRHIRFGSLYAPDVWLESKVTPGAMFTQLLGAVLLILLTLGLAWPLVLHRWIKFTAANIVVHGEINAAELKQASDLAPKASEGLLEALDPGFF